MSFRRRRSASERVRAGVVQRQEAPQRPRPGSGAGSGQGGEDGVPGREPQDLGLLERALELGVGEVGGEVDEGAGGAGDRDVLAPPNVAGVERVDAVYPHTPAVAWMAAADGHVHIAPTGFPETPEVSGGPVAEHRTGSAGQHGGQLAGERRQHRVADRVDASMDAVEPLPGEAMGDRVLAQARGQELRAGDQPPLFRRDPRDRPIPADIDIEIDP